MSQVYSPSHAPTSSFLAFNSWLNAREQKIFIFCYGQDLKQPLKSCNTTTVRKQSLRANQFFSVLGCQLVGPQLFRWFKNTIFPETACTLLKYCQKRDPLFYTNTLFTIDGFHQKGHKSCSASFMMSNYKRTSGENRLVKS